MALPGKRNSTGSIVGRRSSSRCSSVRLYGRRCGLNPTDKLQHSRTAVIILALILFVVLATMPIPKEKLGMVFSPDKETSSGASPLSKATLSSPSSSIASVESDSDAKIPILTISDMEEPNSHMHLLSSIESGFGSFWSDVVSAVAPEVSEAGSALTAVASALTTAVPIAPFNNGMWPPATPVGVGFGPQPTAQTQAMPLFPGQQPPPAPQPAPAVQQVTPWWAGPAA